MLLILPSKNTNHEMQGKYYELKSDALQMGYAVTNTDKV